MAYPTVRHTWQQSHLPERCLNQKDNLAHHSCSCYSDNVRTKINGVVTFVPIMNRYSEMYDVSDE